jgi:transposase
MKDISRGRLGDVRAVALYEGACNSPGIREGSESILFEIKGILSAIETTERFIEEIESRAEGYLQQIPYSRNILSIKGIGIVTAAGIIGEVGDFDQFGTIKELMKLAGLDLYEISSGNRKGRKRISKRGRPLLRKILYYAALNVVRREGALCDVYQGYLERGMIKTKALVAISRKLVGIIFALVRDRKDFIPGYGENLDLKEAA